MTELRNLLADVAESARTYDVLDTALRRGRRRRVVRPFVATAMTMVAVLAAGAGTVSFLHWQRPSVPASTGPSTVYYSDGTTVLYRFGDGMPASAAGQVLNHVLSELSTGDTRWHGQNWDQIMQANLGITTTIDARAQAALEQAADPTVAGSVLAGQPSHLQAAGVLVEPGTGRVLAYYGGHDPVGADFAGIYRDADGDMAGYGAHPAGGTFMAYTLAAALKAGYSLDSQWQWTPHEQPGRSAENAVTNTSQCTSDVDSSRKPIAGNCSLLESVQASLNVPLYDVTASVGVDKVLAMARDAGIQTIWNDSHVRVDLGAQDGVEQAVQKGIGLEVGIGQYAVTVLDQANAMATFAAGGLAAKAHFVRTVSQGDVRLYDEYLPAADSKRVLTEPHVSDLSYALSSGPNAGGVANKTGVWALAGLPIDNAHAWDIGYTSALAGAVWIGSAGAEQRLRDKEGRTIYGSGLPRAILLAALQQAQTALGLTPVPFGPPSGSGDLHPPGSR